MFLDTQRDRLHAVFAGAWVDQQRSQALRNVGFDRPNNTSTLSVGGGEEKKFVGIRIGTNPRDTT